MPASLKASYQFEIWTSARRQTAEEDSQNERYQENTDLVFHGPMLSFAIDTTALTGQ